MLYSGRVGKIKVAGKETAHIANFTVDQENDIKGISSFGKKSKEKVPGMADWTASADGAADFAEDSGQRELQKAYKDQEEVTCTFYLDDTTFLTGSAYIKKLSISHDAEGNAEVSIELEGNGELEDTGMTPKIVQSSATSATEVNTQ